MTCTRCNSPVDKRGAMVTITALGMSARADWQLCSPCSLGLTTWYQVRKGEFASAGEPEGRINAELLHACRMALDACRAYPAILDVLRAAIKGALR